MDDGLTPGAVKTALSLPPPLSTSVTTRAEVEMTQLELAIEEVQRESTTLESYGVPFVSKVFICSTFI